MVEPGFSLPGEKQEKESNKTSFSPISGQSKIHAYLNKTKTVLKLEDNAHNEHQHIQETCTEYSQGTSGENIKTTGKQLIHQCNQQVQYKL